MENIIDFDQRNFNAAGSSPEECIPTICDHPTPVELTIKLEDKVVAFLDTLCDGTSISRANAAEMLLRWSRNQFVLGMMLSELGLPLDTQIPGVTAYTPIPDFLLDLAMSYLDLIKSPKEVLPDGE